MTEPPDDLQRLCNELSNSIFGQLQDSASDWSKLNKPQLIVQALVQDAESQPSALPDQPLASYQVDLSRFVGKQKDSAKMNQCHLPTPPPAQCDVDQTATGNTIGSAPDIGTSPPSDGSDDEGLYPSKRRKMVGCLRPARSIPSVEVNDNDSDSQRQMQINARSFPKRRRPQPETPSLQATTLDKFITGVWENIHSGINPALDALTTAQNLTDPPLPPTPSTNDATDTFTTQTHLCRRITLLSRTSRALEVIIQARWTEHFAAHVASLAHTHPHLSPTKHHKLALASASAHFGWTEKELRNKMAIWQAYKRVKDAAGWAALVFAGMGFYRFCKYRVGLDGEGLKRLEGVRVGFEVAADTVQPGWRGLLRFVAEGEGGEGGRTFAGHPHDWVVNVGSAGRDGKGEAVRLGQTYPGEFLFEHVEECVVDEEAWGEGEDPRSVGGACQERFLCETCGEEQWENPKVNACQCFPALFGSQRRARPPVQVFRTPDGRNNGLMALCPFERGAGIGEFVGLITRGIRNLDVMECEVMRDGTRTGLKYQIWQGKMGNFTRFVNHSCKANAQFQRFVWRGKQRVLLTSKGIAAGTEITVDYSGAYWKGLDKKCLCGEACCRYAKQPKGS